MLQLDPDRFLNELGRLFERAKAKKNTVSVTLKRSTSVSGPIRTLFACVLVPTVQVNHRLSFVYSQAT